MARAPIKTKEDPRLIRPIEEMVKVGDPSKLMALSWKAEREIDATVT